MVGRVRRSAKALVRTYRSWRLLPAMVLLLTGAAIPAIVAPSLGRGATGALVGAMFVGMLLAFIAAEVLRQDRLRKRAIRRLRSLRTQPTTVRDRDKQPIAAAQTRRKRALNLQYPRVKGPSVSVIVTAFNESNFVEDCLSSVRDQTFGDLECIVVDDGSTDDTLTRVVSWTALDSRFRVVHLEGRQGLSTARNVGLNEATCELVTFLDADDYLYPDAVASRYRALIETSDPAWVVGTYCSWHPVPETVHPHDGILPPRSRALGRISWFDALDTAPFVSSAALLRRAPLLEIGGFREDLSSSEDFEFWARLLRSGYVLDHVRTTGIAYRQKRNSMFRTLAYPFVETAVEVIAQNYKPLAIENSSGPFLFGHRPEHYQHDVAVFRRCIVGIVASIDRNGVNDVNAILSILRSVRAPYLCRVVDVEMLVLQAATRLVRWTEDAKAERARALSQAAWEVIAPELELDPQVRRPITHLPERWVTAEPIRTAKPNRVRDHRPMPVSGGLGDNIIALVPSAAYHMYELGPLAELLISQGYDARFLVSSRRLKNVLFEASKYTPEIHVYDPEDAPVEAVVKSLQAIVTMNDWGEDRAFIEEAARRGVPNFAKVEGVQDFLDADVHWERRPYRTAEHILCQGPNDAEALDDAHALTVVGSTRLERIWRQPPVVVDHELAIINLNFTYGVLTESRDLWLATAIEACNRASIPYLISMHPAERKVMDVEGVATQPMRHLLTQASVLISRFSTVPFEAMARGVPFVYHNPHGERVPTFKRPAGAFGTSSDVQGLSESLREARGWVGDYRQRCRGFFLRQVSLSDEPAEVRTLRVLQEAVRESSGR